MLFNISYFDGIYVIPYFLLQVHVCLCNNSMHLSRGIYRGFNRVLYVFNTWFAENVADMEKVVTTQLVLSVAMGIYFNVTKLILTCILLVQKKGHYYSWEY